MTNRRVSVEGRLNCPECNLPMATRADLDSRRLGETPVGVSLCWDTSQCWKHGRRPTMWTAWADNATLTIERQKRREARLIALLRQAEKFAQQVGQECLSGPAKITCIDEAISLIGNIHDELDR